MRRPRKGIEPPLALIAASRDGARLAARLHEAWPWAELHVLGPYLNDAGAAAREARSPLGGLVEELFARCRGIVFFLPLGAVIRLIAPYLRDKSSDPAVVVVDDGGRFAVSALSGHSGGANALAEQAAGVLEATPVVTTAIERHGMVAPELLGKPFGWRLEASRGALLNASVALSNQETLGIFTDEGIATLLPAGTPAQHFESLECLERSAAKAAIIVTVRPLREALARRYVVWRPRSLVAGMGCSAGAPAEELEDLLRRAMAEAGYAPGSLLLLATIDRRLSEPGLVELARRVQVRLVGYTSAELAPVTVPNPSEVVRRAVGTPSVSEAAALLASGAASLSLPKRASQHGTVAIAVRRVEGDG